MVVSCSFTFGEANYNSLPCCSKTNHERSTRLSAKAHIIEGTGHWLHAEKPSVFNAIVARTLEKTAS